MAKKQHSCNDCRNVCIDGFCAFDDPCAPKGRHYSKKCWMPPPIGTPISGVLGQHILIPPDEQLNILDKLKSLAAELVKLDIELGETKPDYGYQVIVDLDKKLELCSVQIVRYSDYFSE